MGKKTKNNHSSKRDKWKFHKVGKVDGGNGLSAGCTGRDSVKPFSPGKLMSKLKKGLLQLYLEQITETTKARDGLERQKQEKTADVLLV